MTEVITDFHCKKCKKYYSSYQSLWIHNKKFHNKNNNTNNNTNNTTDNTTNNTTDIITDKKYYCNKCNRDFINYQNRWKHEKICKQKSAIINNKLEKIVNENIEIKKENSEIKNMLKELLEKNCKIHPKTLQKINKQLINNNNTNNGIINNGPINNGPVINNTFVKFGNEQLSTLLKHKDMLKIINKQCLCIEESIKTVHFNKNLPEYNNIFITNMKDTIAYIFDGSRFILTSKDEVINNLYNNHLENIEQFLDEAEIPENKYSKITKFLDILNDDEKCFIDGSNNNKKYSNYKAYKLIAIKNLIYNESDQKLLKKLNNMDLNEKMINEIKTDSDE
jgi:hypothetical protein